MAAGCAVLVMGGTSRSRMAGLGRVMPLTSFGIVVGGLSLIGVPGTAGFITKWNLILAALERSQWWLVFAIVLSSLLAVVYVWRFVEAAYFRAPAKTTGEQARLPRSMAIGAWIMLGASVYLGFDSSLTLSSAATAAQMLIEGPP